MSGINISADQATAFQNQMGSLTSAVSGISEQISAQVTDQLLNGKGTTRYVATQNNKLKGAYDKAKQNVKDAPFELSSAEKSYYVYNEGTSGGEPIYNTLIIDRFAKTANEFRNNSIEKQQQFMTDLSQLLKQYQAEQLFATRTEELFVERTKENNDLIKKFDTFEAILNTNQRKFVYEDKDTINGRMYRRIMLFLYYGAIICYIVFANFITDKLYLQKKVWLILVSVSLLPLILNLLIRKLFVLMGYIWYWFKEVPHKDVYWNL